MLQSRVSTRSRLLQHLCLFSRHSTGSSLLSPASSERRLTRLVAACSLRYSTPLFFFFFPSIGLFLFPAIAVDSFMLFIVFPTKNLLVRDLSLTVSSGQWMMMPPLFCRSFSHLRSIPTASSCFFFSPAASFGFLRLSLQRLRLSP